MGGGVGEGAGVGIGVGVAVEATLRTASGEPQRHHAAHGKANDVRR